MASRQTAGASAAPSFDVVVIGSGPAGVAVAERLYDKHPSATIAVVEQGSMLLRRHFYANGASIAERDRFLARHQVCPWRGDLGEGGALLPALGGRGIVGGSQLHRFYRADLTLWEDGSWPLAADELDPYFVDAEARLLAGSRSGGPAQERVCGILSGLDARHPPCGPTVDTGRGPSTGLPHHSSVQRLLALLGRDRSLSSRRLTLFTETRALGLVAEPARPRRMSRVRCVTAGRSGAPVGAPFDIRGGIFVLAASAVESARLVLVSGPRTPDGAHHNIGRYLMEHIYCRGHLDIAGRREIAQGPVNVFVPPQSERLEDRFQIELSTIAHPVDGRSVMRVTGSAAMDPQPHNRVTLSPHHVDGQGVPRASTVLRLSPGDERRRAALLRSVQDIAVLLGGRWLSPPSFMPKGASYHEVGALRIAQSPEDGAAAPDGALFAWDNVYVGDGSAFPSVGVANPILTLTAMGYRLADRLAARLAAYERV